MSISVRSASVSSHPSSTRRRARPSCSNLTRPAVTPFRVTGETGLETRLEVSEQFGLTPYVGRQSDLSLLERYVERAAGPTAA